MADETPQDPASGDPAPGEPRRAEEAETPGPPIKTGAPETYVEAEDETERTWGMACHLAGLLGLTGIPFGNIIGPLIVWLIKKDQMPFVDQEGKEALNFQISIFIYVSVSGLLTFLLIGIPLLVIVGIFYLVMTIYASVKSKSGQHYRYPFTLRFL